MSTGIVLIIDDEEKLRTLLARIIRLEGMTVLEAETIKAGNRFLDKEDIDVVLCDVKLPDGNGVDFVREVKARHSSVETILLTAYGNIADGVTAMKNGAFDYITKGDDNDKIIPLLARALEKVQLQKRVSQLEQQVGKRYTFDAILGHSPLIADAIALARKVAPTEATVLLLGETGTGKEVFAQSIHYGSKRATKPFIALNCSAFGKELLESELFGHKAGSFTSATRDKKGLIEEANLGTLFLDEIGEMHIDLQAKLLRVLETSEFIKVGDTRSTRVNVRIIAATNRDLQNDVTDGRFRDDLFYRLNVFTISLPALRDRKKDIPLLAEFYLRFFSGKGNKRIDSMSKEFLDRLQQRDWKGNIRELRNVIERAVILSDGPQLNLGDLPADMQAAGVRGPAATSSFDLAGVEKLHIQHVLNHTRGNKTEAARLLNIGLTTLYRKIEEYRLSTEG
ncbi:sigma-54 dependent transcriptional regulator [Puia sp.]|jgi:DNA-binding NtrC family response regulator|uniref:sigma-54-dependent transcriptional regulator n=1 Tax=Puia sp. TaxID=2045100 RepID=UPI002F420D09